MDIRFITPEDFESCNEFHNRNYGTRRTLSQWRWEFLHGTMNDIPFVVVEDEGHILGTQALIPIQMIDSEGVYMSAKSEETLIASELRGKGVFDRMYQLIFDWAESHGIVVIWGFTPATKAFAAVGFNTPCSMSQLFLPLTASSIDIILSGLPRSLASVVPHRLAGRGTVMAGATGTMLSILIRSAYQVGRRKTNIPGLEIGTLHKPPNDGKELCSRFIRQWGGTTILRDEKYLKWRFFENPYLHASMLSARIGGHLAGWIAFSVDDQSVGYIIDLMVAPENGALATSVALCNQLLGEAVASLRKMGAVGIRAWTANKHPMDLLVVRTAKWHGFFRFSKGGMVVLRPMTAAKRHPSATIFDSWYVNRTFTEGTLG